MIFLECIGSRASLSAKIIRDADYVSIPYYFKPRRKWASKGPPEIPLSAQRRGLKGPAEGFVIAQRLRSAAEQESPLCAITA